MNQTVNISFEKALLKEIDKIAKKEHRSRSELIREAARAYIEKKSKWERIFEIGSSLSKGLSLTENSVVNEIKALRKLKKSL
ncbi:ribbon-helix-helix protein, CopG family [Leptospira wolffii]|uniref:CopG family transcriptional regulator n=1 Tax=Leptospira wolffii TaxID=409998 RepID=A0A2M9Z8Y3_9LEPT|nr:ribbon-helix-helix domain-containing protein [Leptospira wolffii]PJZ64891.1 CopG family transcriptional regulator [Leptospira wolffii]TGK58195.1 ribbon-helix-helix protein, CopG family [Leptospira wolffii]TGK67413.1 ribbon-helix-helix protein, CopG family [Leptospira wolffii]TGK68873.1 ribbon-helix-helix protein, CopG family [Leptospira wolffii]TGL27225.1 ribbon-helix-helix protein, CopG family [Leptospira wolffii]